MWKVAAAAACGAACGFFKNALGHPANMLRPSYRAAKTVPQTPKNAKARAGGAARAFADRRSEVYSTIAPSSRVA